MFKTILALSRRFHVEDKECMGGLESTFHFTINGCRIPLPGTCTGVNAMGKRGENN